MKHFRVIFERVQQGSAEIDAESYGDARGIAFGMEPFEVSWDDLAVARIEVVDIDELLPDDDE